MFRAADLPDTIPVFPLPGALLLPRAKLPLHIFEPRYLAMLDDVLKTSHRLIGMVQPLPAAGDADKLHDVGCAGRVTAFSETDDGRYMLTLSGISRFRITSLIEGFTPYLKCDVDWRMFERDLGPAEHDPQFERPALLELLSRYFAAQDLHTDWESLRDSDDEMLINSLSMLCPLSPEDRQALLEASSLSKRRETLTTLLEYSLRRGLKDDVMQ
ncbi:MAG: LON peptidase substrate-binding domain-containing protein [Paracoccaceae bacterium]